MKILALITHTAITIFGELSANRRLLPVPSPSSSAAPPTASWAAASPVPTGSRTPTSSVHRPAAPWTLEIRTRAIHRAWRTLEVVRVHVVEAHFIRAHHTVALLLLVEHRWRAHHSWWNHRTGLHSLRKSARHVAHWIHSHSVRNDDLSVPCSPSPAALWHWSAHVWAHLTHVSGAHHLLRHLRHWAH